MDKPIFMGNKLLVKRGIYSSIILLIFLLGSLFITYFIHFPLIIIYLWTLISLIIIILFYYYISVYTIITFKKYDNKISIFSLGWIDITDCKIIYKEKDRKIIILKNNNMYKSFDFIPEEVDLEKEFGIIHEN